MNQKIKSFLQQNWFKLIITIAILLVGLSLSYYYLVILPKNNTIELQAKCATQAQKTLSNFEGDEFSTYSNLDHQSHYNSRLNKCFVAVSYLLTNNRMPDHLWKGSSLFDAYENKKLADLSYDITGESLPTPLCIISGVAIRYSEEDCINFVRQKMELEP